MNLYGDPVDYYRSFKVNDPLDDNISSVKCGTEAGLEMCANVPTKVTGYDKDSMWYESYECNVDSEKVVVPKGAQWASFEQGNTRSSVILRV